MPSVTQDGITVESRTGTEAEMREQLGPPADPKPVTPPAAPVADRTPAERPAEIPDAEPDPASEAGKKLAGRRKSLQDRIDEVTWEKHEERRKREAAETELAALKQPKTEPVADGKPRMKAYTERIGTDFEDWESANEQFTEDLADWKLAARDQSSVAQQAARAQAETVASGRTKGLAEHADFDDIMGTFVSQGGTFDPSTVPEHQRGPLVDLRRFILDHPKGYTIAYLVAKDPALYQDLMTSPTQMVFLGKMASVLARVETAPSGSVPPAAPVSKAKPPVKPVVGQPTATSSGPPGDDASDDEYRVWANQQERSRRRRA